jgi:acetylornithine deacetylase
LDALKRLGLQPASEVIIQSVPEEESTGNGTLMTHIKGYKADAMLCPEPVQEQLVRANVGVLWFQVEVRGRPTHVRVMGTGVNAIDACWRLVAPLRELEAEWNERHAKAQHFEDEKHPLSKISLALVASFQRDPSDPVPSTQSTALRLSHCLRQTLVRSLQTDPRLLDLNVAMVDGGDWQSSVPSWARLSCRMAIVVSSCFKLFSLLLLASSEDLTLVQPGVSARSAAEEIERKISDFSDGDDYLKDHRPIVTWNGFYAEGYVLDPGTSAEDTLRRAHQSATGKELTTQTSGAYLDAR